MSNRVKSVENSKTIIGAKERGPDSSRGGDGTGKLFEDDIKISCYENRSIARSC
jgi:hypothetical protein